MDERIEGGAAFNYKPLPKRVLWRAEVAGESKPRVIARPRGAGNTDANVSPEEALRRNYRRSYTALQQEVADSIR